MTNKLKVGIAGYGVVGRRRRIFIDKNPWLHTVAVSDINLGNGLLSDGIRTYADPLDMLKDGIEVLFVSLPNYLAPQLTITGLQRGCHVFCEKPPGRNVQDLLDVIKVKHDYPELKLKYGFNHRYHDSVTDALGIASSQRFGRIIHMRGVYGKSSIVSFDSDWRTKRKLAGGGILLDQGIHMLDMMRMFVGDFKTIYSVVTNDYWKHDVEDNAYALMQTKDGIVATLHSSATQWRHTFTLEIGFERGLVELRGILSGSKSYGDETITVYDRSEGGTSLPESTTRYTEDNSWKDEVDDFSRAICFDEDITTGNVSDALSTLRLVYQIYCADSEWKNRFDIDCPEY